MIHSMTGYGDAQHSQQGISYTLEIRSLNNRYFKANIKLPEHLQCFEANVEKLLRSRLGRGSVSFICRLRSMSADAAYDVNTSALQAYLDQINAVSNSAHGTIDLGSLLSLPGVCQPRPFDEQALEHEWEIIRQLTDAALHKLIDMRRREGQALREDLLKHTAVIREQLAAVTQLAPTVVQEYHKRLGQRVAALTGDAELELDKDALAREVAVFAERCDISEEVARLNSHLDQFDNLCDSKELVGRKLEFLAQEMLREANTTGSKANDATIARHVVEIKSCIDRLKEQVQNAE